MIYSFSIKDQTHAHDIYGCARRTAVAEGLCISSPGTGYAFHPLQSEMEKMRKTQHVQAVYIRKMQALPGKVGDSMGRRTDSNYSSFRRLQSGFEERCTAWAPAMYDMC